MRKTTLFALVAIALVVIPGTFAIGYRIGFGAAGPTVDVFAGITPQPEVGEEVVEKLRVFWEAWDQVQNNYYEGPLDPRELVEGATRGMVRSTGDAYTDWVDAKSAKIDRERLEGHFQGIGATVELDDEGLLKIVRPLPGSPAEEAGLRANDVVLAVDGADTKGKTLEELVILVRGPSGTTVVLTIRSEGETESREVSVVRGEIVIPSVVAKAIDEFGYIRLSNFGANTTDELRDSIRDLRSNGAEGIILDLRNNPGGLLSTAIDVAGEFFPAGTLVVSEKSRTEGDIDFKSSGRGSAFDLPIVVLINGGSASASEIVAAAIKDHGRGKLLGQPTFGKGSVQIPYELRDDSVVRVTVAIWETPGGTHLTGEGIEPDFLIEQDATDLGGDDDPYLEAARRVLRGQDCCEGLAEAA